MDALRIQTADDGSDARIDRLHLPMISPIVGHGTMDPHANLFRLAWFTHGVSLALI